MKKMVTMIKHVMSQTFPSQRRGQISLQVRVSSDSCMLTKAAFIMYGRGGGEGGGGDT